MPPVPAARISGIAALTSLPRNRDYGPLHGTDSGGCELPRQWPPWQGRLGPALVPA
jgi:hypothetical protein